VVLFQNGPYNPHFIAPQLQFDNESEAQIWKMVGEQCISFIPQNRIKKILIFDLNLEHFIK